MCGFFVFLVLQIILNLELKKPQLVLPALWGQSEEHRILLFLSAGIYCLGNDTSDSLGQRGRGKCQSSLGMMELWCVAVPERQAGGYLCI